MSGSDKLSAGIRGVRRPAVGGFELDFNSNKETNDVCQPGTSAIKGTKRSRASRIRGRRIAAKFEAQGKGEITNQRLITAKLTPHQDI